MVTIDYAFSDISNIHCKKSKLSSLNLHRSHYLKVLKILLIYNQFIFQSQNGVEIYFPF